ncbi:bifunctional heptose 7-phosphate kinase/heptose 1-phosphate adenyltransferase [Spirosoma panaciterrae]|uniref:bifunctional heptose 7-phosphate kinase/heptose 1-phosphate adenyltransferase n=1 Tax=Spirosoma panaciterrae TaxID=496058 RepID=UPI00037050C5|nr:PfkB family carbohydrate kinase [Spirosoma panaciterrae]
MTATDIQTIFEKLSTLKVGVIGDFAIDLYFNFQPNTGEQSIETGLDVFWGSQPKASLGAAGNVIQNLTALGVGQRYVVGCVGNDLYGREMQHLFRSQGVDVQQLQIIDQGWDTCLYTKPMIATQEANRIDFGTANELEPRLFDQVLAGLENLLPTLDVLIINQQFARPLLTDQRMNQLNELITRFPAVRFVADMRTVGKAVRGVTLKVNTAELAYFLGIELPDQADIQWCVVHGTTLRNELGGPLLITRGQAGILYLDESGAQSVEGLPLQGELDTVGAGDTVVAAWAACMGAGATPRQALDIANLAAAVTVQKLGQTGTASLPEILDLFHTYHSND